MKNSSEANNRRTIAAGGLTCLASCPGESPNDHDRNPLDLEPDQAGTFCLSGLEAGLRAAFATGRCFPPAKPSESFGDDVAQLKSMGFDIDEFEVYEVDLALPHGHPDRVRAVPLTTANCFVA